VGRVFTSDLYDTDSLAWAEQQAELLRRVATGERVSELVDWPHVIEEVQDVGLSELRACRSLLRQALVHLLKLHLSPDSPDVAHWRGEVATFLTDAQDCFVPSMRQRIDIQEIYADALYRLQAEMGRSEQPLLSEDGPFTLDDLVAPRPDVTALVAKIKPVR
jgi:hypothetical protein